MEKSESLFRNIEEWPVAKASRDRKHFIDELNHFIFERLSATYNNKFEDIISKTVYLEKQRTKFTPWKVDPVDEKAYWNNIGSTLDLIKNLSEKENAEVDLLKKIINRYSEEIVGHFDTRTFKFSRWFLTTFFKRLFNRYFGPGQWRWGTKKQLLEKIKVTGDIPLIQKLFTQGTVVILPTHFSNLDSIMVGYAIDTKIHLPVFSYGAGLNLYNVELAAYFMNRLGAYRVDRRKKNPIYLECLKSMASYSLAKGINNIFFPGGTRSRSGATESKVKLGLIGSLIEAQRLNIESGKQDKIFVVTMNLNYHFVLEAGMLANQYLRQMGKEKHGTNRQAGAGFFTYLRYLGKLFKNESDVQISLGRVMDVFGNSVNEKGQSLDKFGHVVQLEDYFKTEGKLTSDPQRESIYTRLLGDLVVKEYTKNQIVLTSNLVAFAAFQILLHEHEQMDVVSFVNSNPSQMKIPYTIFREKCIELTEVLKKWEGEGILKLSTEFADIGIDTLIQHGISHVGVYHTSKVLFLQDEEVKTEDLNLLFFYHNRLTNYAWSEALPWIKKITVD